MYFLRFYYKFICCYIFTSKSTQQFIDECIKIHGNIYDYSLVDYKNQKTTILINCKIHGIFEQIADNHLRGNGCLKCAKKSFSKKQIAWLEYISNKENIYIQHAMNNGEFKIGKYRVDGYCDEKNICYEFNGCFYHGCLKCHKPYNINEIIKKSFTELYIKTLEKQLFIEQQGFRLITIWEHEWDTLSKNEGNGD